MRRRSMFWQVFPSYLVVTVLAIIAAAWFTVFAARQFFLKEETKELQSRAILVRAQIDASTIVTDSAGIDSLAKQLGRSSGTRITVILASGKVIADTDENPAVMENHSHRPEIQEALQGRVGDAIRYSQTINQTMVYAAVPVMKDDRVIAVVRAARPVASLNHIFGAIYPKVILGVLIIVVIAALASLYISRRITEPLVWMRQAAERFTRGEFQHRLPVGSSEEMSDLARTMNDMAVQLDEKIRAVIDQRNEREAILSSMVEGVIALDNNERIISLNRAAAAMFHVGQEMVVGRYLQEAFREANLQRFVARIAETGLDQEEEIRLQEISARVIQLHGALLWGDARQRLGVVIVLHDVTRLHQLETVRRDFVANVSHELRTPITSIKGFVETLRDGAADTPADTARFLGIIARQVDRLNAIIEDLLALSELEQTDQRDIGFEIASLRGILEDAIATCGPKAAAKKLEIHLQCEENFQAEVNAALLEQAVVNLVDNAVKYSDAGTQIEVAALRQADEIVISVKDHGIGIERIHLPRLFERFYRVDRARSRELGGTGLGLSIVKHIALAHKGTVRVESAPGNGSTFSLHLPVRRLQPAT